MRTQIKVNEHVIYDGPTWKFILWFCIANIFGGMINRAIELIFQ